MRTTTKHWNSREEAARALRVCLRTIDNYIRLGHLQVVRRARGGRRIGTFVTGAEIRRFRRELAAQVAAKGR